MCTYIVFNSINKITIKEVPLNSNSIIEVMW